MGFLRHLFSGKEESAEEREQKEKENNFDVLKYDGIHALQIGRFSYAIACFTHALDLQEDQETREYLALAYIRNDDLEMAVEEFSKLIALHPDNKNYAVNKANLLYELEEYESSRVLCQELLDQDSELVMPLYLLARLDMAEGHLEEAEDHVSDALSKREDFYDGSLLRAEIRYKRDDYEGALSDLDNLIENGNVSDEVLLQKGMVLASMGKSEEAILYYNNVLSQNPFIVEAYGNLAMIHIKAGEYDKASEVISDGLEQNGESSLLISIRAELKDAQGNSEGAESDRKLAEEYKIAEEERKEEDYDVEREMQERMKAVNPLI